MLHNSPDKTIAVVGRARVGKSFLVGMFAKESALYRDIFCGAGADETFCTINNIFMRKDSLKNGDDDVTNKIEIENLPDTSDIKRSFKLTDTDCREQLLKLRDLPKQNDKEVTVKVYLEPSDFCLSIMNGKDLESTITTSNRTDRLTIVDIPGVSGDTKLSPSIKADLFIFVLRPENAQEAKTLGEAVSTASAALAGGDTCFLYRVDGQVVVLDDYAELTEIARKGMVAFDDEFRELRKSIIDSSIDALDPAGHLLLYPTVNKKYMTLAESCFKKELSKKILHAFRDAKMDYDRYEKLVSQNGSAQNYLNALIEKVEPYSPSCSGNYTYDAGYLNKHFRTLSTDGKRIRDSAVRALVLARDLIRTSFSKYTINDSTKGICNDPLEDCDLSNDDKAFLIQYVYNTLTRYMGRDFGIGYSNHWREEHSPITMLAEESIHDYNLSDLDSIASDWKYRESLSKSLNFAISFPGNYDSWKFAHASKREYDPGAYKKLELVIEQLPHRSTYADLDELILYRYYGGLYKYAIYELLKLIYKDEKELMGAVSNFSLFKPEIPTP